jgi:hypothetical protein
MPPVKKLIILFIISIVMLPFGTGAIEWKLFYKDPGRQNFYYDSENLKNSQENLKQIWHKIVFLDQGTQFKEFIFLDEFNCSGRTYLNLDFRVEKRDGELEFFPGSLIPLSVDKQLKMKDLYEIACKNSRK